VGLEKRDNPFDLLSLEQQKEGEKRIFGNNLRPAKTKTERKGEEGKALLAFATSLTTKITLREETAGRGVKTEKGLITKTGLRSAWW